jgi:hypothetical protein
VTDPVLPEAASTPPVLDLTPKPKPALFTLSVLVENAETQTFTTQCSIYLAPNTPGFSALRRRVEWLAHTAAFCMEALGWKLL